MLSYKEIKHYVFYLSFYLYFSAFNSIFVSEGSLKVEEISKININKEKTNKTSSLHFTKEQWQHFNGNFNMLPNVCMYMNAIL